MKPFTIYNLRFTIYNLFRNSIIFLFLLTLNFKLQTVNCSAQQVPLESQYMMNEIVLNPAIAGSKEIFVTRITHRSQWVGIKGAPITQTISAHGLFPNTNHAIGGFLFNDIIGPLRATGLNADYAFHIVLNKEAKLSLGVQGGIFQYAFNANKVTTADPDDNAITGSAESKIMPDASFGVYYYTDKYYAGISTPHLIEVKFKLSDFEREKIGHLSRHYLLYGGYILTANENFSFEPSLLLKAVAGAPLSLDINTKFLFSNVFWAGASYRTGDAIVLMLGVKIQERFHFGYSYDITLSDLKPYSKGSHEIMLGYDFDKPAGGYGRRR